MAIKNTELNLMLIHNFKMFGNLELIRVTSDKSSLLLTIYLQKTQTLQLN